MAGTVEELRVARPPEEAWDALADFGAIARWAPNVDHSCLATDQREGVGAVRRVQVGRNALLERVVTWEPGHRLGYAIEGLPPILRTVTNTWSLEGSDGSTTLRLATHVDAGPRPPQQVVARVVARRLAAESRQMLAGLRAHLEEAPT